MKVTASVVVRSLVFAIVQIVLTVFFTFVSLLTFPLKPINRYRTISTWSRLIVASARIICGIHYEVRGKENIHKQPSIIMSKHQSAWETLAFQVIFPPQVWVLKKQLLWIPFFGWGLAMLKPIAIDRRSTTKALKQTLTQGRERLADGFWVVVFPEGTRVVPGARKKYQSGGAWLAARCNAPIVPVAHNAGELWPKKSFLKYPGVLTVSIGEPIDPNGQKPEALTAEVESWIESEMLKLPAANKDNV